MGSEALYQERISPLRSVKPLAKEEFAHAKLKFLHPPEFSFGG
jgi:hypothetical protein